jgi:hypothetical protein
MERSLGDGRLRSVERHLASMCTAAAPASEVPQIPDPYPDPGDYRCKALAYVTKPSPAANHTPSNSAAGPGPGAPVLTLVPRQGRLLAILIAQKPVLSPHAVRMLVGICLNEHGPHVHKTKGSPFM